MIEGKVAGERNAWDLQIFDLRTGKLSVVPSSQGLIGGMWVTQDTLVAATEDTTKLLSFDFKSQKWSDLATGNFVNRELSIDSKYLNYTTGGADPKVMRIRLADRAVETIASLKDLRRVVDPVDDSTQVSVAPDASPVFTRDIGTEEIYALDVKWP